MNYVVISVNIIAWEHAACVLLNTYDCVQDEEDLEQRTEYLRQQRDKLHALKRDQTLKTPTESPVTPDPRPHTQVLTFIHSLLI